MELNMETEEVKDYLGITDNDNYMYKAEILLQFRMLEKLIANMNYEKLEIILKEDYYNLKLNNKIVYEFKNLIVYDKEAINMENILKLKFDYENTGFCRTHYVGELNNGKKYNIVIIHEKDFDNILTATKDGEPEVDLRPGILVELNNKLYITENKNGYTTLKEFK